MLFNNHWWWGGSNDRFVVPCTVVNDRSPICCQYDASDSHQIVVSHFMRSLTHKSFTQLLRTSLCVARQCRPSSRPRPVARRHTFRPWGTFANAQPSVPLVPVTPRPCRYSPIVRRGCNAARLGYMCPIVCNPSVTQAAYALTTWQHRVSSLECVFSGAPSPWDHEQPAAGDGSASPLDFTGDFPANWVSPEVEQTSLAPVHGRH